jgi:hypothetical protein
MAAEEAELWARTFFDPTSQLDREMLQLARGDWGKYVEVRMAYTDAWLEHPPKWELPHVNDVREKFAQMCAYCQSGKRWSSIEDQLGIPYLYDQVVILTGRGRHGREEGMFGLLENWEVWDQDEFEDAVIRGESIRGLQRRYRLTYALARKLVMMIRGTEF